AARSFERLAGYRRSDPRFAAGDRTERVRGALVTPGFFELLGARPRLGRLFEERGPEAQQAKLVVISHLLWREQFREDPAVLGRTLRLNGEEHTVIGVLPEAFQFTLLGRCDVWRPLLFTPEQASERNGGWLVGLGRLAPGRSVSEARQE